MTIASSLPAWAALLTSCLVLLGAALTMIGALGLLRFDSFYKRVHAPTLGTTLGAGSILVGSMVCFSVLQSRPVVHEILIAIFMTITTPVTLMLLVRAAVSRDFREGSPAVAGLRPKSGKAEREQGTARGESEDHRQV